MKYVEFGKSKNDRNKIKLLSNIPVGKKYDHPAFQTLHPFGQGIVNWMLMTKDDKDYPRGTTTGYEGLVNVDRILWDLDDHGILPIMDAKRLVNYLNMKGVPWNDIHVEFSGSKGFHIWISSEHLGGPFLLTAPEAKRRVSNFCDYVVDELKNPKSDTEYFFNSYDPSVYGLNKTIRVLNSKHDKSGLYKIEIPAKEFIQMYKEEEFKERAKNGMENYQFKGSGKILVKKELLKIWEISEGRDEVQLEDRKYLDEISGYSSKKLFDIACKMLSKRYNKNNFGKGMRNNFTFEISALCNDLGVGIRGDSQDLTKMIFDYRINEFGDSNIDKKGDEKTIESVYKRYRDRWGKKKTYIRYRKDKVSGGDENKVKILTELDILKDSGMSQGSIMRTLKGFNRSFKYPVDQEWIARQVLENVDQSNFNNKKPMPLYHYSSGYVEMLRKAQKEVGIGFKAIDELEDYMYRGKCFGIIGKGGVGKSLLFIQILEHLALNGQRVNYSSMEDNAMGVFKRMLYRILEGKEVEGERYNPIGDLKSAVLQNWEVPLGKISKTLKKNYDDYFLLDEKVSMGEKEYKKDIDYILNTYGDLYALGIDGLGAMKKKGRELDALVMNSFKVKELANHYNVFVPILLHTPSGVEDDYDELWRTIRGGEKVGHNLDGFFSLSRVAKDEKDKMAKKEYKKGIVKLVYYGKRYSGEKVTLMLKLNPKNLKFEVMGEEQEGEDFPLLDSKGQPISSSSKQTELDWDEDLPF
jgi:hypothetical protein